jgi:hypothetical protein
MMTHLLAAVTFLAATLNLGEVVLGDAILGEAILGDANFMVFTGVFRVGVFLPTPPLGATAFAST